MNSEFILKIKSLHWINDNEDDPEDLCCHGEVEVTIGNHFWEYSANVSASALYFLKTLSENHIIYEDNQMIPCCGHFMLPNEDGKTVTICGCTQGIDWTVLHEDNAVKMVLEDETEVIIPFEKYREQVFAYVDEIEAFYNSCEPKKMPKDEWEKDTYLLFWQEWHRRRGEKGRTDTFL
ncbi:MAG: hypothetical protein E7292_00945 [Lachnospiraceae bacterium]|nr:hypothetical protein [Lachnospiraceae bacterium]